MLFMRSAVPVVKRFVAVALLMVSGVVAASDHEASTWEMRVCAPSHQPPMSSREEGGFNNRIAEILADELGAEVTYEWTLLDRQKVQRTLLSGECDVIIGISEGSSGVLSTVPYLRAPYTFVTRADADIDIASLQDPVLQELRIGTYHQGLPSLALDQQGVSADNIEEYPGIATSGGIDRSAEALQAVVDGEVDVAIVYGPEAAGFDAATDVDLDIEPVTPEIVPGPSLIQMSRTWTIGVRPGDEAFRDRLNLALSERWEDVRAAIDAFDVPQAELTPSVGGDVPTEQTSIGVIVPEATGGQVDLADVGGPARHGAELAENVLAQTDLGAEESRVLYANAPNDAATYRAAERLIATENVAALAGGFDADQAERLARIADEGDVLFFNVGATGTHLRQACLRTTFHVEASDAMLADAAVDWFVRDGAQEWFLVHEASRSGEALAEFVNASLADRPEASLVGTTSAEPSQFVYADVIQQATESGADGLLVSLAPEDQDLLLSQFPTSDDAPRVAIVPRALAQTREFMRRFREVAPQAGTQARAVTWDAAVSEGEAGELNERYLSRNAAPMEPVSWTMYAAVTLFHYAVVNEEDRSAEALVSYLTADGRTFELGKGLPLFFREQSRQLKQPLYLVRPDLDVEWSTSPRDQADFGDVLGQLPEGGGDADATALDAYGVGKGVGATCDD